MTLRVPTGRRSGTLFFFFVSSNFNFVCDLRDHDKISRWRNAPQIVPVPRHYGSSSGSPVMLWLPAIKQTKERRTKRKSKNKTKEKRVSAHSPSLLPPLPPRLPLRAWRPPAPAFVDAVRRGPEGGY